MLKFIQKSLVICSASLGISGLACAKDGWEYDSNGRYDMFSSKNHARADMLERKEAQASKAKTAQYEPYRHPLNGNPYGPPVYIPAASYHGTPSAQSSTPSSLKWEVHTIRPSRDGVDHWLSDGGSQGKYQVLAIENGNIKYSSQIEANSAESAIEEIKEQYSYEISKVSS